MATYDIRPLQLHILEILEAFDACCKRYDLRYYLIAGTLLGAIRHKGFIPWDDDLDVAMPRPDYDLLMEHADEFLPKRFELISAERDKSYPLPFAKLQDATTTLIERSHLRYVGGIYIDIFPLDGMTLNPFLRRWHFARYEFYKQVLYLIHRDPYKHGHGPSSWAPLLCRRWFTLEGVQQKMRRLQHAYGYDVNELIVDHDDGLKGVMEKSIFGTAQPVEFEGKTFLSVAYPDDYLKRKYGDYMTIPPHDNQRQHNFHYLNLKKGYREDPKVKEYLASQKNENPA